MAPHAVLIIDALSLRRLITQRDDVLCVSGIRFRIGGEPGALEDRLAALIEAGTTRLRPILMTTFAMVGGMLPLFLALGAGAEMRAPMARAVVGGLITSTVLTLIVVPVFFDILDEFTWAKAFAWAKGKWTRKAEPRISEMDPDVIS